MKQFLTLLAAVLLPFFAAAQAEVTFNVDMTCAPEFETVFVTGPWCGWCAETGDNVATDDDGDGVYTVTLGGFDGTVEYKYAVNGFALQEDLVNDMAELDGTCAPVTDFAGYANRSIEAGSVANDYYGTCDGVCNDAVDPVDNFAVTFNVDLSEYTGTFNTVNLNGGFNGWCGGCAPMADEDGDGVYTLTVDLASGTHEYKFTLDGWNAQEEFTEGDACTSTIDGFTNRTIDVTGDVSLPEVCYNSCDLCDGNTGGGDDVYSVTFQVDMSESTETFTTVNLNGTFNEWCGGCAVMTDDDADGVYTLTVDSLAAGTYEYKFTLDGWNMQEEFTPGDPCTTTIDGYTNRTVDVNSNAILDVVCYNSCAACGGVVVETADVTFRVDMSQEVVLGPIYISGNTIDGWAGTSVEMLDGDGDGIYEVTVALEAGDHEYKFNNASWDDSESLDPVEDADCTLTTDGFTNRFLSFTGSDPIEMDAVCFNSCAACTPDNVSEINASAFEAILMTGGQIQLQFAVANAPAVLRITSLTGALVGEWNVPQGASNFNVDAGIDANGVYLLSLTRSGRRSVQKVILTH